MANDESPALSVSRNLWKTILGRSSENTPTWLTSPNRKWLTPILLNTIAVRLFRSIWNTRTRLLSQRCTRNGRNTENRLKTRLAIPMVKLWDCFSSFQRAAWPQIYFHQDKWSAAMLKCLQSQMADTPLLHSWTMPEQMMYVSNWLWDTVWRTTPPKEHTPIRL